MLFKSLLSTATAAFSLLNTANADGLPAIEIVGNKFYYSNNGSQFYIKGIAYQSDTSNTTDSTFVDPLADASTCARDIPYMQAVDTNVIRVYALNASLDHTECMKQLEDAGIYVIADLSQPDLSINRDDPKWNLELLNRYTEVVDDFHNYTNILGFFAGNEVTNEVSNTDASAFVKAAIRDTKAYIKEMGYRNIPVGYSANDDTDIRISLAEYFACGDEDVRADFFGINMYEWCGKSSFKTSGYQTITQDYANLGIPLFFSEYGCNEVTPRLFQEVGTLYSDEMTDVWSGGIVYMYFEEANNYGLVSIDNNKVSTLSDYNNYKSHILTISPSIGTANSASSASATVTTCPTVGSKWEASTNLPPTPDDEVCNCMVKSLSCIVSDDVDSEDYTDLFSNICGYIDCDGISANATTGKYGAYSMCNSKDQLNFLLNLYYLDQDSSKSACDWDGSATLAGSSTTASSCSAILKSAGTSGASAVSGSVATTGRSTTSASGSSGSSSSGSSSSSSTSTKDSGAAMQVSIDSYFNYLAIAGSMVFGTGLLFA